MMITIIIITMAGDYWLSSQGFVPKHVPSKRFLSNVEKDMKWDLTKIGYDKKLFSVIRKIKRNQKRNGQQSCVTE